jgi:NADH-dependent peroxiredoxin subunit F
MRVKENNMYDLIIIGGGPAGLTSAVYAIRKRLNVVLVSKDLGGKTNYHLSLPWTQEYGEESNIIRGIEVVSKFRNELEYLEFARHMEAVELVKPVDDGFMVMTRNGGELMAHAIIVATGTRQELLKVPGEKEYMMKGLCYSALSYAPLFIDRAVTVVGDSELALRSSAELATIAQKVYLVCECKEPGCLDTPLGRKLQTAKNVQILSGFQVEEVLGPHNGHSEFARGLALRNPNGQLLELESNGIFIEKALYANTRMVEGLVEMDEYGRIVVDHANRTSHPGIFAAGDSATGFAEQVLIAVGEGAKAALSAYEYLLTR